jgi:hypothetical protein
VLFYFRKLREKELRRVLISECEKSHGNCADFKSRSYNDVKILITRKGREIINQFISEKNLIGYAGEYFVRYDLIMKRIIPNSPDLPWTPYDIIVYINGTKLAIQVKTIVEESSDKLIVDCRKSNGKDRTYTLDDFDILAVCDISFLKVAYIPSDIWHGKQQITLWRSPPKSLNGFGGDKQPLLFDDFLEFPIPSRKEATA